ncbi:asparagine--tRNA ligase, partial [Candidatus Woesearchaeota archaeon CG10_big_fil_rev_8_21_14_0_10_30_7]
MFVSISDALKKGEGIVNLRGWVYRERKTKNKVFVILRDSSGLIQCIIDPSQTNAWDESQKVLIESSIELMGELKKDERALTGYEVHVKELKIIHLAERFPITKDQSPEFLLDNRHLWLRSQKMTNMLKVRSTVFKAIREFFEKNNYFEFTPPITTPNACEGGSTLFEVKYYNDKTYLT